MLKKLTLKQNIKFLVVGGIGVIINYIIYKFLGYYIHNDIAWLIGIIGSAESNYVLNSMWTYND